MEIIKQVIGRRNMERLNPLDWFMVLLVLVGGGCWLASGLFQLNVVKLVTLNIEWLGRAFYVAVGLAAHYIALMAFRLNKAK